MATRLQDRFFTALDERAAQAGCEVVTQFNAVNTGQVDIVKSGSFEVLLSLTFHFQQNHNVLESQAPVWPRGNSNPNMVIAKDTSDIGGTIDQIIAYLTR